MSLLDKAKGVAKAVGEKAQEGAKAVGEKAEAVKTKRRISELKEEIGEIVFQQRSGSSPENAEERLVALVAEIKEAEAHLVELAEDDGE